MGYPRKEYPVTPCIGLYKENIHSDGILYKLKFRVVVRGYLQNKEMIGEILSPEELIRTLKYFLADASKHKSRVHQLYLIREFI